MILLSVVGFLFAFPFARRKHVKSTNTKTPRPPTFPQNVTRILMESLALKAPKKSHQSFHLVSQYGMDSTPLSLPEFCYNYDSYPFQEHRSQCFSLSTSRESTDDWVHLEIRGSQVQHLRMEVEGKPLELKDTTDPLTKRVQCRINGRAKLEIYATRDLPPFDFSVRSVTNRHHQGIAIDGILAHYGYVDVYRFDFFDHNSCQTAVWKPTRDAIDYGRDKKLGTLYITPSQSLKSFSPVEALLADAIPKIARIENDKKEYWARPHLMTRTERTVQALKTSASQWRKEAQESIQEKIQREFYKETNTPEEASSSPADTEAPTDFVPHISQLYFSIELLKRGSATVLLEMPNICTDASDIQFLGDGHVSLSPHAARITTCCATDTPSRYTCTILMDVYEPRIPIEIVIETTSQVRVHSAFDASDVLQHVSGGCVYTTAEDDGWTLESDGSEAMHVVIEAQAPPGEPNY